MSDDTLLPSNATPHELAMESATSRLAVVPVTIRDLWNPRTCPVDLLPYLAWSLSLDAWKPYWSEAIKRQRIRDAIAIQRKKGTAQAVRSAVSAFGSSVTLREWWQTSPKGTPHTFDVKLTLGANAPGDSGFQADIINEINRTKPVRSHFTLTAGLSATGGIGLQAVARTLTYKRLTLTEA